MPIEHIQSGPRMSQVVIHDRVVYLSGQVAAKTRKSAVAEQAQEVLSQIDALLAEAGTNKSNLLSATIWLTDMSTFADMNRIWEAWVVPGATPARATVATPALASPDYKIEISVIAARDR